MKKIAILLMLCVLLCSCFPSQARAETLEETAANLVLDYPDEPGPVADRVHDRLIQIYPDEQFVCALLGNFAKESNMCPERWEGDDTDDLSKSAPLNALVNEDLKFPRRECRYYFSTYCLILGHYGFGLAQWTAEGRKLQLYDLAVAEGKEITDLDLQIDFILWELENNYPDLYEDIRKMDNLAEITVRVASRYERTHAGTNNMAYRYAFAKYYYDYYTAKETEP